MKSFLQSFRSSTPKSTTSTYQSLVSPMLESNGLTVVELFQSQGCSSCPPANSNVLKLAEDPALLILTYDVTYWDRLGWKDTFGKTAFDQRQWEYARALKRQNVFTPQVRESKPQALISLTYLNSGHSQRSDRWRWEQPKGLTSLDHQRGRVQLYADSKHLQEERWRHHGIWAR